LGVEHLLYFGRVSGKKARLHQLMMCRCHENAAILAIRFPKRYQRETGWALYSVNDNGRYVWGPHSWAWDCKENEIVETTVLRKAYFGLMMPVTEPERKYLLSTYKKLLSRRWLAEKEAPGEKPMDGDGS
jgi:hypothetical protein